MAQETDRIQIDYQLRFTTPFHFGTGMRSGAVDRAVLRDNDGYLYVPGSTFKGVLREKCEQLAELLEAGGESGNEEKEAYQIKSPHKSTPALYELGIKRSLITRLFGSQIVPCQLFFDDAHQSDTDKTFWDGRDEPTTKGRYNSLQTGISTQVRLDRLTRTSVEHALYTSEFGIRDLLFEGRISGWLTRNTLPADGVPEVLSYSLLLLLAGLPMLERIGANKSTGKGQCSCKITQVKINGTLYKEEEWQSWYDHLELLMLYVDGEE